jgi:hypothetical protein
VDESARGRNKCAEGAQRSRTGKNNAHRYPLGPETELAVHKEPRRRRQVLAERMRSVCTRLPWQKTTYFDGASCEFRPFQRYSALMRDMSRASGSPPKTPCLACAPRLPGPPATQLRHNASAQPRPPTPDPTALLPHAAPPPPPK